MHVAKLNSSPSLKPSSRRKALWRPIDRIRAKAWGNGVTPLHTALEASGTLPSRTKPSDPQRGSVPRHDLQLRHIAHLPVKKSAG
jgi:hypothetical protein